MPRYRYTAYSSTGAHNTKEGVLEASTPAEAEKKIKAEFNYPIIITLESGVGYDRRYHIIDGVYQ